MTLQIFPRVGKESNFWIEVLFMYLSIFDLCLDVLTVFAPRKNLILSLSV